MTTIEVPQATQIHCNRCNESFAAPRPLSRDPFCGQKAARIHDFCTCPHCQQTDAHWLFAGDVMPQFEGGADHRARSARQWLRQN